MKRTKAVVTVCALGMLLTACGGGNKKVEPSREVSETIRPDIVSTEETTVEEYEYVPEPYDETAEVQDAGGVELMLTNTDKYYPVTTSVGYSFKSIHPLDHDTTVEQFTDVPTIQDILSGDYWTGDQVVHRHQVAGSEPEPGFYVEDDCWIEEYVNVQVYPKDGLDKGWVYEEGETFSDWLDGLAEQAAWGEDSQNVKHEYTIDGEKWTVYYAQRNLSMDPKDDFSSIQCFGYKEEANGDFVVVTLKHDNFPTIKNDDHVPTHAERMQTAKDEMEVILSTIQRD